MKTSIYLLGMTLVSTVTVLITGPVYANGLHDVPGNLARVVSRRATADVTNTAQRDRIEQLFRDLSNTDTAVRNNAVKELRRIPYSNSSAIPAVFDRLRDPDARNVISALIERLRDTDADIRRAATGVLANLGRRAQAAVPALIRVIQDAAASRAANSESGAWCEIIQFTSRALRDIRSTDPEHSSAAVSALIQLYQTQNDDGFLGCTSPTLALGLSALMGESAIPTLIHALQNPNPSVRFAVATSLGSMRVRAISAIPALTQVLHDETFQGVRQEVVRSLIRMGEPALRPLLQAGSDNNQTLRDLALRGIEDMGSSVVPAIMQALHDTNRDIRFVAVTVLSTMNGRNASTDQALRDAVPGLVPFLRDADASVRAAAIGALSRIGTTTHTLTVVPPLTQALRDTDSSVRGRAANALGNVGPIAQEAIPALISLLSDTNAGVRADAAWALSRIGPGGIGANIPAARAALTPAIPRLISLLHDTDSFVRRYAAGALQDMGPAARDAVPVLITLLHDQEHWVRSFAATTLGTLGPVARSAIPVFIDMLRNDPEERFVVANALGIMGPLAHDAIAALETLLQNGSFDERGQAAQALRAIRGS